MSWEDRIGQRLDTIRRDGRWRSVRTLDRGTPAATVVGTGDQIVSFASNDYLGLSQHPAVVGAAREALDTWGAGAGAARLIVGSRPVHDELESDLAAWKGTDAAVLFPTGYQANLGVLGALSSVAPGALICSDELNHASIIDGARLSRGEVVVYPHRDLGALATMLESVGDRPAIVVSDSVFSMDGDLADVDGLAALCREHGALLVLDEAHAVLGPDSPAGAVIVGTLSKTLGAAGGFVAGSSDVVDLLRNTARSFIFTTAGTPADAAAARAAVAIVRSPEGDELRRRLRANIDRFRAGHSSPVIPVVVGDEDAAVALSDRLLSAGLLVPAIRPPTVAPGTSRLRIALSAMHDPIDIDRLSAALVEGGC